jgi:hexosaminidase
MMKTKLFALCTAFAVTVSLAAQISIIPKPNKIEKGEGSFIFNKQTVIYTTEKSQQNATYLRGYLKNATGFNFESVKVSPASNFIVLDIASSYNIPAEGYSLEISTQGITIKSSTGTGAFYAIQSLLQLMPPTVYSGKATGFEKWSVPVVKIEDSPRFDYRGMMLDVSRTFFDAETVKRYIDWMSHHKINKFHWHLTDDNGWRVEIKKYPELTRKGAWRGPGEVLKASFGSGNQRYGGFYTQEQIKEIVAYAAERHIEVIPEIDLPGHSKAVTASYPNVGCDGEIGELSVQGEGQNAWCVGKEPNYKMLEDIIKEMVKLFPSKNFHIGGDEVNYAQWGTCPHCIALMEKEGMKNHEELLNYFVRRMETIVEKHGKHMSGWDEILDGGNLNPNSRVYAWRSVAKGIESVTKGQRTIMMPGEYCYFDMKQSPIERGHNWAGIVTLEKSYSLDPIGTANLTDDQAHLILGVQGALWTELLGWPPRFIDYQTYPRLAAIAEVGWTQPQYKEWNNFYKRMTRHHFERMYQMGIFFRVPPPVAKYENGAVKAELPYSWAVVRYTTDESEPTSFSPVYKGEIFTDKPHKFRFATFFKDELKSVTISPENAPYIYLKPETRIETSILENNRFPIKNLTDYKYDTYFRSASRVKTGDYLIYQFSEAVKASRITVETGIPNISFYGVTDGYVEFSYDGKNYIKAGYFERGVVVLQPEKPVLAVKIVITAPNDGHILSLQDLRIEL